MWIFTQTKFASVHQAKLHRYASKLSGPILDQTDLHIWVEPIPTVPIL